MSRRDPLSNFRFRLEVDGITTAGFSEVTIGETTIDQVDYREGINAPHARKLSGITKRGNIILKRGLTVGGSASDLFKWHADVSSGRVQRNRKRVEIVVLDESGTKVARFTASGAWPVKYNPSDLNAKGNEVVIELLELANDGIERAE